LSFSNRESGNFSFGRRILTRVQNSWHAPFSQQQQIGLKVGKKFKGFLVPASRRHKGDPMVSDRKMFY